MKKVPKKKPSLKVELSHSKKVYVINFNKTPLPVLYRPMIKNAFYFIIKVFLF